ncbi:conserved hypothetical protein [Paraburkholderia unamae]|uniref:DUF2442 domain-containing protein n=1 Tax=Paraburkholderia unamae TaxID=219649 RepID=UPI001CAC181C|nr:DUF2442 domain-containing protein [Paraburkholderia unamae]CAG9252004.1 conserved hypothetical protein [Paraburkholderia unamae]
MSTSAKELRFDDFAMWVELEDGRTLGVPLAWFPRLLHATAEQRLRYEISAGGLHWDGIDEDISVEGLLAGRGDMTHRHADAA